MSSTRDAMVKPNSPSMKSTSAAVCSAETALRQNSSASPRKNCSYQFICICFLRILDRNVGETERRSTPVSGQKSEGLVSGRRNYSYAEITITRLRLFQCPLLQVVPRSAAAFKTPPVHRHDNAQPRLQHAPRLRLFTHDAKLHQSLMRLRRTNLPCLVAPIISLRAV